jgi:hypothetical protein
MRKTVVVLLLILCCAAASVPAVQVFSTNSVWRFRRGNSEASSPITAWRIASYNDTTAGFTDAPAPFWHGDPYPGGTQLTDMQNSYSCIFLRHPFVIGNASQVSSLRLGAFVDDGFVAWINGVEVARTNIPAGNPTFQTLSTNAIEPPPFVAYNLPVPSGYLVSGTNMLAVQVFNTGLNSSDLGFDAWLDVTISEITPPVILNITPTPGTVSTLTSITVTFSEPVIGVQADDFLLNGIPPDSISGDASTYTFHFAQPLEGTIFVTWVTSHGITDLATPPNTFNATGPGATWQYDLVDNVPPLASNLYPPAGLTVHSLGQIEITFNEPVLGVDAADLLINSQPATNVTQQPGGPFVFRFPPQPNGLVQVEWASGHGITDAAASPNPFASGSWSYTVDSDAPLADLVITEILAANVNTNGLADEDGEQQDWIEIHNRGVDPVNLANWSLSDDPELPGLWVFPARTLAPNAFLVVFASGKDRRSTNSTARLHTNFKLGAAGEPIALYTPESPRVLLSGFTPYPEQRNDVSYGATPAAACVTSATPTPGVKSGSQHHRRRMRARSCQRQARSLHSAVRSDVVLSHTRRDVALRWLRPRSQPRAVFPASLRIASTRCSVPLRSRRIICRRKPPRTVTSSISRPASDRCRCFPLSPRPTISTAPPASSASMAALTPTVHGKPSPRAIITIRPSTDSRGNGKLPSSGFAPRTTPVFRRSAAFACMAAIISARV